MSEIDLTAILADHACSAGRRCLACENLHGVAVEWPCLVYRLAAELATVTRHRDALANELRRDSLGYSEMVATVARLSREPIQDELQYVR